MKKEHVVCIKKHVGRDEVEWSNVIDEDEKEYRAKTPVATQQKSTANPAAFPDTVNPRLSEPLAQVFR